MGKCWPPITWNGYGVLARLRDDIAAAIQSAYDAGLKDGRAATPAETPPDVLRARLEVMRQTVERVVETHSASGMIVAWHNVHTLTAIAAVIEALAEGRK